MQTVRFDDVNSLDVKACGIENGRNEKIPRVFTRTSTIVQPHVNISTVWTCLSPNFSKWSLRFIEYHTPAISFLSIISESPQAENKLHSTYFEMKEEIFFKSLKNYIPSELIKLLHSYLLQITKKMKGIFMSPNPGAGNNLGKQGNKIHDCSESVQLPQSGKVKFYLMNAETQSCFKQYSGKLLSTGTLWNFLRSPRTMTFCNRNQNNLVTCSVLL